MLAAVNFERAGDVEALSAELALEGLVAAVVAHVHFEVALLGELGPADVALEGAESQVALPVSHQVVLLGEAALAQVAGEGLLSGVLALVGLEARHVREHLAAHVARVLVHLKHVNSTALACLFHCLTSS